ncbi:MAG: tetratricopeptide repeat protein [Pseudomonadota bacterium]
MASVLSAASLVQAGAAPALSSWLDCLEGETSTSIRACSAIIDARDVGARELSRAYHQRARALARLKKHKAVIDDLNTSIRLHSKKNPRLESLFIRGRSHLAEGDTKAALADFDRLIKRDSTSMLPYLFRAEAHLANGDAKLALNDFARAIALAPDSGKPLYLRARAYVFLGNNTDAIADLNTLLTRFPTHLNALYWRGTLLSRMGLHDEAIRDLTAGPNRNRPNPAETVFRTWRRVWTSGSAQRGCR